MAIKRQINSQDNVLRYVPPRLLRGAVIDAEAFSLSEADMREPEPGLSVNWLEYFQGLSKSAQVSEVREHVQREPAATAKFAELNVGETLTSLSSFGLRSNFRHDPSPANDRHGPDPSHALLLGLPPFGTTDADLIGDFIAAELVRDTHHAQS